MLRHDGRSCDEVGRVLGHNYPVVKDLRPVRVLPGTTAALKRSIHGGEMRITR